jgi:hypothetical protein
MDRDHNQRAEQLVKIAKSCSCEKTGRHASLQAVLVLIVLTGHLTIEPHMYQCLNTSAACILSIHSRISLCIEHKVKSRNEVMIYYSSLDSIR